jgi:hypothetical protein
MQKNEKTNHELYIEFTDFIAAGYRGETVSQNIWNNGPFWMSIKNPNDARSPMVHFESLRPKDKRKLNEHFNGSVYDYFAKQPIEKLFIPDPKAEQFYQAYRYGNELTLPMEVQIKYTRSASVLNGCIKATETKRFIKDELGLKHVEAFWSHVLDIIKAKNIDLPSSYGNLVSKPDSAIKQYKANGYESLIHKNYGNKSAAKIGKTDEGYCVDVEQKQIAVIRKIARLPMNFDAVQITSVANSVFEKNNWQTISPGTVANLVKKHMPNIIAQKRGSKVYANTVAMQVQREAPQFPLYYWTLDGWSPVELLYRDGNTFSNRLTMVVVLDACTKYPVGYAIGERENTDLIRMALRNAIIHMQDLFGATYRPWQLQSDRYGMKNLTSFYSAVSHLYTPAAVGNAKAKIIEPYFKYLNKTYCQLHYNWSGFNITSKKDNQPNVERLNEIKQTLPDKEGVIQQINSFMLKERMSKVQDYKQRWDNMPADDQVTLTPVQCLEVFGKAHNELNSITGQGLIATLEGQQLTYDSFDPAFRALQFTSRFKIVYDTEDLSHVLAITEDNKQKFVLHNKMKVGMGFKNTTPEQLDYQQQIRDFNTDRHEEIVQTYLMDDAIVADVLENTPLNLNNTDEAALKLMFTISGQQKEAIQDAKGLHKERQKAERITQKAVAIEARNAAQEHQDYLDSKTDFTQYLDN